MSADFFRNATTGWLAHTVTVPTQTLALPKFTVQSEKQRARLSPDPRWYDYESQATDSGSFLTMWIIASN